jgi:hypothetical protein
VDEKRKYNRKRIVKRLEIIREVDKEEKIKTEVTNS